MFVPSSKLFGKCNGKSDDIRIKYASKYAQSSNYWKNSIGMNQAVKELKVIEKNKLWSANCKNGFVGNLINEANMQGF